ncbi:MAG: sigma-70 family RNA polymerase sigma factor [Caldilineaceae bacterium]
MSDHCSQPATSHAYKHRTFDPSTSTLASSPSPVEPITCWQLWEARQAYFYQRCLGWLRGNQADADDAFNTAALAVWRTTHEQASTIVNPMGWLTGVVHHACLDLLCKRQREASQTVEIDSVDTEVWAEAPATYTICRSPETIFLQREQCAYLQAEMAALPARLRIPLALRCGEELSYEEIAAQLGLTPATVRKRIQEARILLDRKLRKYLRGQAGPDWDTPWTDEQTLFVAPPPKAPLTNDDETVSLQPRVTPLAQVSKREEQKLRTLRAYIATYPNGWKKRLELADQLCKMGMKAEAVVVYEQVLEKQPQLLSVWMQVGRLYKELQCSEAAVAAYERALAMAVTDMQREVIVGLVKSVVAESK